MLAITRFSVAPAQSSEFLARLTRAHDVLSLCSGYKNGEIGQNLDDPTIWVLMTSWENVGSYRRALSSNAVRMEAIPILADAIDEPGAFNLDINI